MVDLKNKWILVTGASSGLGKEMALQLAKNNSANLILVARREEQLLELQNKIKESTSVQVDILRADLADKADTLLVSEACLKKADFYGAVLNAGVTYMGKQVEISEEKQASIINLNIVSTTALINSFVKHFEDSKKEGKIMVVSSLAAVVPIPYQAVYSGTKAYLTSFVHSLKHELRNPKLSLSIYSPGGIKSEMSSAPEFKELASYLMSTGKAASEGIYCFLNDKHHHVPGIENKLSFFFMQILPKKFLSKMIGITNYKSIKSSQSK